MVSSAKILTPFYRFVPLPASKGLGEVIYKVFTFFSYVLCVYAGLPIVETVRGLIIFFLCCSAFKAPSQIWRAAILAVLRRITIDYILALKLFLLPIRVFLGVKGSRRVSVNLKESPSFLSPRYMIFNYRQYAQRLLSLGLSNHFKLLDTALLLQT